MTQPSEQPVMHGGAERLPLRWINADPPPARLARYQVQPGQVVTRHVHTGKTEYWVVLKGAGLVRWGDRVLPVAEGDVVVTPPGIAHGLDNPGPAILEFLNIVAPTGDAEITTTELE